jgi:serine/threonine-protein kinase
VALDARSDLYSLGVLAYFLLTGQPPLAGKTVLETLIAHLHQAPIPLTDHCPHVPVELEAIVLPCLAKEPAARPASADELDRALLGCRLAQTWTEVEARAWWTSYGACPGAASVP